MPQIYRGCIYLKLSMKRLSCSRTAFTNCSHWATSYRPCFPNSLGSKGRAYQFLENMSLECQVWMHFCHPVFYAGRHHVPDRHYKDPLFCFARISFQVLFGYGYIRTLLTRENTMKQLLFARFLWLNTQLLPFLVYIFR